MAPELPDVLASDGEREHVATLLRDAAGEGRLTVEDLTVRLERAYGARTRGELARLTADLPAAPAMSSVAVPASARRRSRLVVAVMSGARRKGRWRPGSNCTAVALMGGCYLDLREAEITDPVVNINAVSVMGGIQVIVPEGVEVNLGGLAIMGGKESKVADVPVQPGTPVINVRALTLMGGVSVRSKRRKRLPR
jgi:hypothetical protein